MVEKNIIINLLKRPSHINGDQMYIVYNLVLH